MTLRHLAFVIAVGLGSLNLANAAALTNRGVVVQWITEGNATRSDGSHFAVGVLNTRTIWVSAAGRLFQRVERRELSGGKRTASSDSFDKTPDSKRSHDGGAGITRVVGNTIVHQAELADGALQFVVTFDPSMSSCSVNVSYGRSGSGPIRLQGLAGPLTVESMRATSPSCKITDGNPLQ